jgi:16S rRNA pseudouridine516 synthase
MRHVRARLNVTLTEGKYHQVRRMFAATGATVLTLHRAQFGRSHSTG